MEVQNKKPIITVVLKCVPTAPGNKFVPIEPFTFTYDADDDHEYVQENIEVHTNNNIEYYLGQDIIDLAPNFFTRKERRYELAREIVSRHFIDKRFCFRGRYVDGVLIVPKKISCELDKFYVLRQYVDSNYDLAKEIFGNNFVVANNIKKGSCMKLTDLPKELVVLPNNNNNNNDNNDKNADDNVDDTDDQIIAANHATQNTIQNTTQKATNPTTNIALNNIATNNIAANNIALNNAENIENDNVVTALDFVMIDGQEYVFARQLLARAPVFFYMCSNQRDLFERVPPNDALYVRKNGNIWVRSNNADHSKDNVIVLRSFINKHPSLRKEINGIKDGLFGLDGVPLAQKEIKTKRTEKFLGIDGQVVNITTVGDRTLEGTYFLVRDIIDGFGVARLDEILSQEGSAYVRGVDYVDMLINILDVNHRANLMDNHETGKKRIRKERFVSFEGLIRAAFVTRNAKMRPYINWVLRVIFVVQFGTTEQKKELYKELFDDVLGTDADTAQKVLASEPRTINSIYAFTLGKVVDLRESMNIDGSFKDDMIVCKIGQTDELPRRITEHKATYKKIKGSKLRLTLYQYIDSMFNIEAETAIKRMMKSFNANFKFGTEEELIIITVEQLESLRAYYESLGSKYMGAFAKVINELKEADRTIKQQKIDSAEEIKYLKLQHQNDILNLNSQNERELNKINIQNEKEFNKLKDQFHAQNNKYEKIINDLNVKYTEQLNELKNIIATNNAEYKNLEKENKAQHLLKDTQHEKQLSDLISQQAIKNIQHEKELNELKHQNDNTKHQYEMQHNELKTLLASKDSLMTIKDLEHRLKLNEVLLEKHRTEQPQPNIQQPQPQQRQPQPQQPSNIRSNAQPYRQVQRKQRTNHAPDHFD